ncbi:MAG TPA: hypothetical protein VNI52_14455 [Sphingobacteriaceae bacterium]|nr:hypothetical protein [Sphingobacteriaceae bacterium]
MEAIKILKPTEITTIFDESLKELLMEDLEVFKSTRGRFLCNNPRKNQNNPMLVA